MCSSRKGRKGRKGTGAHCSGCGSGVMICPGQRLGLPVCVFRVRVLALVLRVACAVAGSAVAAPLPAWLLAAVVVQEVGGMGKEVGGRSSRREGRKGRKGTGARCSGCCGTTKAGVAIFVVFVEANRAVFSWHRLTMNSCCVWSIKLPSCILFATFSTDCSGS